MSYTPSAPSMMGSDPVSPLAVVDAGTWEVADGILFSVLSSLVLWSVILTNLYKALT